MSGSRAVTARLGSSDGFLWRCVDRRVRRALYCPERQLVLWDERMIGYPDFPAEDGRCELFLHFDQEATAPTPLFFFNTAIDFRRIVGHL